MNEITDEMAREFRRLYTIYRSTRKVAEITGVPRSTVRWHIVRDARIAMRGCGRPRLVVC